MEQRAAARTPVACGACASHLSLQRGRSVLPSSQQSHVWLLILPSWHHPSLHLASPQELLGVPVLRSVGLGAAGAAVLKGGWGVFFHTSMLGRITVAQASVLAEWS